ncbi:MAG: hydrogenase nickel incorporation protein HypB [Thermoflexales bacterium]|nr:hydrogenase nickel incorporation protein HypB [Thermoflexales bacterium]MDW8350736.1 hydrogenase nickel incorporation protein HypB [Anaerolineae bacterium]
MATRYLEIRQGVLSKNDQLAAGLRDRFARAGLFVTNWVSSPGAGKTALLERMMAAMRADGLQVAAVVGDLQTDNDARRLSRSGAPVRQITTDGMCHLEADMLAAKLEGWDLDALDFLFIENVGNLVCPTWYDLGEDVRLVLLSVTEGEDKPLKYPVMFNSADVAVITKVDLAVACECDLGAMRANIHAVRPGMRIFETSAKTGAGLPELIAFLLERRRAKRAA